jgi:hypothetical protein
MKTKSHLPEVHLMRGTPDLSPSPSFSCLFFYFSAIVTVDAGDMSGFLVYFILIALLCLLSLCIFIPFPRPTYP